MCAGYGGSESMYKGRSKPHNRSGRPLMRGIPIDILRAFVAVVEARGFTRAAEELGRTQPTISLQVKRLEELVERPVFQERRALRVVAHWGSLLRLRKTPVAAA